MRRAILPPERRVPFSLYADEFQNMADFMQGVEREIECWCYEQHQPLTNPWHASLLDRSDLSQHALQLLGAGLNLPIGLAQCLEPLPVFELPLVQTALGTLRCSNDSPRRLSRAR